MKTLFAGLLMALTLWSCISDKSPKTEDPEVIAKPVTDSSQQEDATAKWFFKIGADSVTILPFEIAVKLSPKAEEKIVNDRESIIVDVFLDGTPKDSANTNLEEDGSFSVGSAKREILNGQVARFDSIKFSREIYDQLADKDVNLTVNVYSGRKSSRDNLLSGGMMFDQISNVVNKKHTIACKLIYGDD